MEKLLYSMQDAAKLLDISRDTLERRIRAGELRAVKPNGGHRKIVAADLRAYTEPNFKRVVEKAGFFYIIQLVPDLAPQRVKFGWARDLNHRVRDHRVSAPTAVLLWSHPCHSSWERHVIAHLANGERVSREVFDVIDVERTTRQAERFFAARPVKVQRPYSGTKARNGGAR